MNDDAYKKTNRMERAFGLHYDDDRQPWLHSQQILRRLVGTLGILLPLLLVGFVWLSTGYWGTLDSISHYYFTRANSIFTGVVSLLAIFLIIYKGYDRRDFYISLLASLGALTLVLLPTDNVPDDPGYNVVIAHVPGSALRVDVHYISAGVFLGALAYMSMFLFTKGKRLPSARKKARNAVYFTCGVVMVIALLAILLRQFDMGIPTDFYDNHHLTFWLETVAVVSFGISWMVKGDTVPMLNEKQEAEVQDEVLMEE